MKTESVKGFKDYTGEEAQKRAKIKEIIVGTFEKYGLEPAETPVIENEEFVKGSSEQAQDEVISDIFKLKDKGKRDLALRYEFTFQLKRIAKNKKLPYRRYQIGEVFRDEPSSGGKARFRQFTQCDVDVVGISNSGTRDEAEILALTNEILEELKISNKIFVGNKKLLNEILEELKIKENKEQILKEIDKLDKLPEEQIKANLKKFKAEKILSIFKKPESYFKKYKAYKEIEELKKYCSYYNVRVFFQPSLVRGLSYYKGNVWEIKTSKLKETICGGGSYFVDGIQSTGISFGLERISQLAKLKLQKEKFLVVSLGQDKEAIKLAQKLRKKGKNTSIFYGKPSKALEFANSYGYNKVIFVGDREVKAKKFKVKDMASGRTRQLKL